MQVAPNAAWEHVRGGSHVRACSLHAACREQSALCGWEDVAGSPPADVITASFTVSVVLLCS